MNLRRMKHVTIKLHVSQAITLGTVFDDATMGTEVSKLRRQYNGIRRQINKGIQDSFRDQAARTKRRTK